MKPYQRWKYWQTLASALLIGAGIWCLFREKWPSAVFLFVCALFEIGIFLGFWRQIERKGVQTELDISRVLGKDAKEALSFGEVGILTYNDEFVVTWMSDYFREHDIDLLNRKLTAWIDNIRDLFDSQVDTVTGKWQNRTYEITRPNTGHVLFVKDITEVTELKKHTHDTEVVVGMLQLDNYMEYQSYENEDIVAVINTQLRGPMISWSKHHGMFVRRVRSDRIIVLLDRKILKRVRQENFDILQEIKDRAAALDVSITLSMAFAYGTTDFVELDTMLSELIEAAQSRGGDQCAIKKAGGPVEFIGGNSETSSQRSKVRVRIMAQSVQDAIKGSRRVYIAGHLHTDYDCMGAALALSSWVQATGKDARIMLKGVERDGQLDQTMDFYADALRQRHTFVSPEQASLDFDPDKDLLILADHSIPEISSASGIVSQAQRILVIDHHRRSPQFVDHPMLTYVESQASSTCELVTELLQNTPRHVPIYEAEATIMYLGLLVDTNRFKMHTGARTFETAATLRAWGANIAQTEKSLQEDIEQLQAKAALISSAQVYMDKYMLSISQHPLGRTMLSQTADALLQIKGTDAAFAIAPDAANPDVICVSARSNSSCNVQKIMEKMDGGGHFSAAAAQCPDTSVQAVAAKLKTVLKEEEEHESHSSGER